MASTSETGHARNIANFQSLVNSCAGYGAAYQPMRDSLKLTALQAQLAACAAAQSALKQPLADYNQAVSKRAALYKPLSKLTTRIMAMFRSSGAPQQVQDFAKTQADKIRGIVKPDKPAATTEPANSETPEDRKHSTSQRSYVMMAENFETLIGILKAEPSFKPAEPAFQPAQLEALLANMSTVTNEVDVAYRGIRKMRSERNLLLYKSDTGMVDTALSTKDYAKGAFGTDSPSFKEIKGLRFTRSNMVLA